MANEHTEAENSPAFARCAESPWGLVILLALMAGSAGALVWTGAAEHRVNIVKLELAGSAVRAVIILQPLVGDFSGLRAGLRRDYLLIGLYAALSVWIGVYGLHLFRSRLARSVAVAAGVAGGFAAVCDLVEDHFLSEVLNHAAIGGIADRSAQYARAAAAPKWLLLGLAGLVGVAVLWTGVTRALRPERRLPNVRENEGVPLYDSNHP